jgi:hypothetical protein
MVLPLALLAARLATCQHPRTINPPAADNPSSFNPLPGHAAPNAAADASPASSGWFPFLSYLRTCPVSSSAEAFRALLPYASLVIIIDNWLHPLPLPWQAAVNGASWLCLASCTALLRMRHAPAATTGSGDGAASGAMNALTADSNGSASKQDVTVFSWEVATHCMDGLLLAVLLPLAMSAWGGQRARKRFLQTLQKQQQIAPSTAHHIDREHLQPIGVAATDTAAAFNTDSSMFSKAAAAVSSVLQRLTKQRSSGLVAEVGAAAAAADAVTDAPVAAAAAASSMTNSANSSNNSAISAFGDSLDAAGRPANGGGDAELVQLPRSMDRRSMSSGSNIALAPATPAASDTLRVAATRQSIEEESRSRNRSPVGHRLVGRQVTAAAPFGATASEKGSARSSMDSESSSSSSSSSSSNAARSSSSSPTSSSSNNVRGRTTGGNSSSTSSQQLGSGGGTQQPAQQQQPQQQPAVAASAAAAQVQGVQVGCSSPRGPNSALYQSPLETVVISFKLAAAPGARGIAAAPAAAAGAPVTVELGATGSFAAAASLQQQQGLAASGASSQLRADIDAAVRAIVAQLQLQVVTTSVSSFPGCVHVVMSVSLGTAEMLQQLAAERASNAASSSAAVGAAGAEQGDVAAAAAAAGAVPALASMVDWDDVVQQLQQRILQVAAQEGVTNSSSEPLQLRYMMVQDSAAQTTHWMWQAPGSSAADMPGSDAVTAHDAAAPTAAAMPAGEAAGEDAAAASPAVVSIGDIIGPAAATEAGLSAISSLGSSDIAALAA